MFNIQGSEIIIILLLALVVLGPEKLPEAMRKLGKTVAELKKMSSGFQEEFKSVLDEPMREARATADLLKKSVDFTDGDLKSLGKPDKPKSGVMADAKVSDDAESASEMATPPAGAASGEAGDGEVDGHEQLGHDDESRTRPAGPAFHSAAPRATAADPVKVSAPFASWPPADSIDDISVDTADETAGDRSLDSFGDPDSGSSDQPLSPPAAHAAPVLPPPLAPAAEIELPAPTGAASPDPTESS